MDTSFSSMKIIASKGVSITSGDRTYRIEPGKEAEFIQLHGSAKLMDARSYVDEAGRTVTVFQAASSDAPPSSAASVQHTPTDANCNLDDDHVESSSSSNRLGTVYREINAFPNLKSIEFDGEGKIISGFNDDTQTSEGIIVLGTLLGLAAAYVIIVNLS